MTSHEDYQHGGLWARSRVSQGLFTVQWSVNTQRLAGGYHTRHLWMGFMGLASGQEKVLAKSALFCKVPSTRK